MKILVYGAGGVGSFIGAFLKRSGFDVTFLCRGERFNFLKSNGLRLESILGNIFFPKISVLKKLSHTKKFDIIINTVKLYDFESSLKDILDKLTGDFIILPFQNGVYAEELIKKKIGQKKTFGAVAQISSTINNKQVVKHNGRLATFFVGSYNGKHNEKLEDFCQKSIECGLNIFLKEDIRQKVWEKFIFLSAFSGITTLSEKPIGDIFGNKDLKKMFVNAMNETYTLAKLSGVCFKQNPVNVWLEKISKMPNDYTSSMFVDYKNEKKLELDWLSGFVVKNSKKHKINCNTHEEIFREIMAR